MPTSNMSEAEYESQKQLAERMFASMQPKKTPSEALQNLGIPVKECDPDRELQECLRDLKEGLNRK